MREAQLRGLPPDDFRPAVLFPQAAGDAVVAGREHVVDGRRFAARWHPGTVHQVERDEQLHHGRGGLRLIGFPAQLHRARVQVDDLDLEMRIVSVAQ